MRNINELIGIIKGISFDGIINDKEVIHLQSWIDKNRNLTYEPRQNELISLVDSVLEDHIIDDNERILLLSRAEEFLDEGNHEGKIYELNGIVEGIVCDGKVNQDEIYRLKDWMDTYGNLIREHKLSEELCKTIDNVLNDGVITEEEQQRLLEMLSNRIKDLQFETKLDYLCKQVKARKNIGIDLIDILDNESAMVEIHKRAESQLIKALSSYSNYCENREIIVVSLVLIAMLEYDGNFYDSVRETYTRAYRNYSEQKVEGLIRSILSRYKRQNEDASRTRIINIALENAIVPQTFLSAFFEFIFDIYKLNFEYDLPEEPYNDFKFVFEGLRSNIISEGDDISINVTQKTYKLIVATKQLMSHDDGLEALIKLSILVVRLIDKRFWDKEVNIFNPYLKIGYEGWEKQLKETTKGNFENRKSTSEFRSNWEPKFIIDKESIYLSTPAHRVKAQYNYNDIAVVVLNNGVEIYRNNNCYIKEIIGGYQVNPLKIPIERPLGKLTYRLVAGADIIYDSKEKLYRNYIVFNNEGKELDNNTDYEGRAYFCYKAGEAEIQNISKKEYYCVGYKLVRAGDAINMGHDVFNFSSMIKPGIFGQLYNNCFVLKLETNEYLSVYKEVDFVAFEANDLSNKFEIIINDKHNKISEMEYSRTTLRETIIKYVVALNLQESKIYTIEINQIVAGKKNKILKECFVYDSELIYGTEGISDELYRIAISSGILQKKIDTEIFVDDFNLNFIDFDCNGKKYNYLLPLNLGFYKIDDGKWNISAKELWIDDISLESIMLLFDSECDGLLVYREDGTLAESNIAVRDKGVYKEISIGFLNSYKNSNTYVMLVFTVDGKKKYEMFCYNKCIIDKNGTEILFSDDPKKVMVTPVFHGKNSVFFEMFNEDGKKIYTSRELQSGQTEELRDFNSFEDYTINFHEKTKILMLRKNTLLYTVRKTFYARQDYVGKVFKIDTVYFDQFIRGKKVEKDYHFNRVYVRITNILGNDRFEGQIFVKTSKEEWDLNKINPVEVEICSEIIDDTMDVYMTNHGDGLLLDFDKHGILNALEHPTAPDIFLYTVRMKVED